MNTYGTFGGDNCVENIGNTAGSITQPSVGYCAHRLPCGLCTFMHSMCPLSGQSPTITWTTTTTTSSGEAGERG